MGGAHGLGCTCGSPGGELGCYLALRVPHLIWSPSRRIALSQRGSCVSAVAVASALAGGRRARPKAWADRGSGEKRIQVLEPVTQHRFAHRQTRT